MASVKTDGLDEFNPFTENFRSSQPAVMNTGNIDSIEKYKSTEETSLIASNKNGRGYRQSKNSFDKNETADNNWPPIPEFCPCQPCFYQNISEDIPERMRTLVTAGYYIWVGYSITMVFNVLGALAYFLSTSSMEAGLTFGMSVILVILLPVLIFIGWFRPLYRAAKFDSSMSYFMYFLISFLLVTITSIQCVGINWLGACGWLNGTIVVVNYRTAGSIMLVIATMFTILLVGEVILLIQVHRKYRNIDPGLDGHLKKELTSELKRSDSIREIATASMRSGTNFVLDDIRDDK